MEEFIHSSITSILSQTFKQFELIIINDGSTDRTHEIITSFKDERIIYLNNKINIGCYASRNRGLEIAKGEYIAVMDGDDIAMENRLERQFTYMENHLDVVVLGTDFKFIPRSYKKKIITTHNDISLILLKGFYYILHPSLLIRIQAIREINGYDEKYQYASDYDLVTRLSFLGKIENLAESLMKYRKHKLQISNKNSIEQRYCVERIRKKYQIDFINTHRMNDQQPVDDIHVDYFQMGVIIAYYTYARRYQFVKYEKMADKILDLTVKSLTTDLPVSFHNGLCGFACSIIYLLRNHFIKGNEDEVLEEIDTIILKYFQTNNTSNDVKLYIEYRFNKYIF